MKKCCANCSWSFSPDDEENLEGYKEDDPERPQAGTCCLGNDQGREHVCDNHNFPQAIKDSFIVDMVLSDLLRHKRLTPQRAFEQYITNVLRLNVGGISLYGELNGQFTFTNYASIYQLLDPFSITEYILERNAPGKSWTHKSRLAYSEELKPVFENAEKLMGAFRSRALLGHCAYYDEGWNREPLSPDKSKVLVFSENGENASSFSTLELYYLATFLTPECEIYLSRKKPILYGESEKGRAYILGIREFY